MPYKYINASSALLKNINQSTAAKAAKPSWKLSLEHFISAFFYLVPEEDVVEYSVDELKIIATGAFNFLSDYSEPESKIRVFNPTMEEHGWQTAYTIVEMVNVDKPFLVDSVSEELTRQGYDIYKIFHPVLDVKRGNQGVLEEILESEDGKQRSPESMVHFQISHTSDKKKMSELQAGIERVLKSVAFSVADWPAILDRLDVVTSLFSLSSHALEPNLKPKDREALRFGATEVMDFFLWLKNNNFVFLGYEEYECQEKDGEHSLAPIKGSNLGLYRHKALGLEWDDLPVRSHKTVTTEGLVEISKSSTKSPVHRHVHMDCVSVHKFDEKGNRTGEHRFLGLFTSQVYFQTARNIPILRKKLDFVQSHSGFKPESHNGKALVAVLESFPRDELFQMSEVELFEASVEIVALAVRQSVKLFVRKDELERFLSCIVYLPRERMSTGLRKRIEEELVAAVGGRVSNHYTQITESHLARLQIIIKTTPGEIPNYNVKKIEEKLVEMATSWEDKLLAELKGRLGERKGDKVSEKYTNAFSVSYTNRFTAEDAYYDIQKIEKLLDGGETVFDLYETPFDAPELFQFKIYHRAEQIRLSSVMPVLENMGVSVVAEHTYSVNIAEESEPIWIHHFRFTASDGKRPKLKEIKLKFEQLIAKVWSGDLLNDGFNQLVMRAHIDWKQVMLLRAYGRYLQQVGFRYSLQFMHDVLASYPSMVNNILDYYVSRFDVSFSDKKRQSEQEKLRSKMERSLSTVRNLAEDKVLRSFVDLVTATLRTNYFQEGRLEVAQPRISFKFDCKQVPDMPLPRPYAEIFVYSPRVEAVHLRGGKVARGGLRWSDRPEDFRTEVLGLMKAQMTKNTVIVPVGSKGGFVVKKPPQEGGREALVAEAIECYKIFLRGMLDITDNIVDDKVVPPKGVVRHDGDDPYLVVAPDKGTATFSDVANSVSEEYGFWLGDAFASGGSVGYDHKVMGITAKGAWISVETHFSAMGIDVSKDDHTAIAIGDMSGDVFGNGMLCSKHTRLLAAFNHLHIFIDPNPVTASAYKERKRLFDLPRSSWTDYNESLISHGGGVFERSAKSIKITREMKQVFNIKEDNLSPDELIRALLKAPVDLLWNGGIGTYFKASTESHEDAGDRANDVLRINGCDIGAKVVGEGGNLGATQRGRIEYASKGGRINTDFIDNSGGVDCSDYEVNIKIALYQAIRNKSLAKEERTKVLESMTDEVSALVLRDNRLQNQALTIAELQGPSLLEVQERFLKRLESKGLLMREIEFLPNAQDFGYLHAEGRGLTRPELSVVLAYSKLSLYEELLRSKLPDDPYYLQDLMLYFPKQMQEKFQKEIESHQLRREIIATFETNSIVNRVGSTFFFHVSEETGMGAEDIARAYTVVRDIFGLRTVWKEIEALNGKITVEEQGELFTAVQNFVERVTLWLLNRLPQPMDVGQVVSEYKEGVQQLSLSLAGVLSPIAAEQYNAQLSHYKGMKLQEALAKKMASLEVLASACDIVRVAKVNKLGVDEVAKIYFELGARLGLDWMRKALYTSVPSGSYWSRLSLKTLVAGVSEQQIRLTAEVIKHKCSEGKCDNPTESWVSKHFSQIQRFDLFMQELKSQESLDLSTLVVAAKRVEGICVV